MLAKVESDAVIRMQSGPWWSRPGPLRSLAFTAMGLGILLGALGRTTDAGLALFGLASCAAIAAAVFQQTLP